MNNLNNNAPAEHDVTKLPVRLFIDGMKAIEGFRLCVLRWKAMKDTPKLSADRVVQVRKIILTVQPAVLQAALLEAFEGMQDAFIRETVEAAINAGQQAIEIDQSSLSAESIAAWNNERSTGSGKLSGDIIKTWFDNALHDQLFIGLCLAKGIDDATATPDQLSVIEKAVDQHKQLFTKLASPTFTIGNEGTINQLLKAVSLASTDDTTTVRIANRVTAMKNKQEIILTDLL